MFKDEAVRAPLIGEMLTISATTPRLAVTVHANPRPRTIFLRQAKNPRTDKRWNGYLREMLVLAERVNYGRSELVYVH